MTEPDSGVFTDLKEGVIAFDWCNDILYIYANGSWHGIGGSGPPAPDQLNFLELDLQANQTIPDNTRTDVTSWNVVSDFSTILERGGAFDDRIDVSSTAELLITGWVRWDENSSGTRWMHIFTDSSQQVAGNDLDAADLGSSFDYHSISVSRLKRIESPDSLYMQVAQNSGGNLDIVEGGFGVTVIRT